MSPSLAGACEVEFRVKCQTVLLSFSCNFPIFDTGSAHESSPTFTRSWFPRSAAPEPRVRPSVRPSSATAPRVGLGPGPLTGVGGFQRVRRVDAPRMEPRPRFDAAGPSGLVCAMIPSAGARGAFAWRRKYRAPGGRRRRGGNGEPPAAGCQGDAVRL